MAYQLRFFHPDEYMPTGYEDQFDKVMDKKLLKLADDVRELLNVPCYINGGSRQYCGWRPKDCKVGAPNSYHKRGMAVDLHPQGVTAEDARTLIRKAVAEGLLPELGGVEEGVSWLHLDVRPRTNGNVLWFHV